MKTVSAGTRVTKGYYFSTRSWMLQNVAEDGQQLPGGRDEKYVEVPLAAAFVVAPLMGALFLMFLPLAGFALTAQAAAAPLARTFRRSATEVAATLQPGWQPGEAHLTGRAAEEGAQEKGGAASADELTSLQREIKDRRHSR